MTSLSLVPEIAEHKGLNFETLVEKFYWMQASIDEKKNNNRFCITLTSYNNNF